MIAPSARAFDRVAATYDRDFTRTALGRELRARVWERLAASFSAGQTVLELNCGTGEDAMFLAERGVRIVATDGSEAMLDAAREKAERRGLANAVRFERLDLTRPSLPRPLPDEPRFDGVYSNFGGLNCVEDLRLLSEALAARLRPGAAVVLVVMGPLCLWETVPSLLRAEPRRAFRRLAAAPTARVGGDTIRVHYRWPSETARALGPGFTVSRVEALGVALPPSLWSQAMEKRPGLLRTLRRAERGLRGVWPFRHLGDHHIIELRWSAR